MRYPLLNRWAAAIGVLSISLLPGISSAATVSDADVNQGRYTFKITADAIKDGSLLTDKVLAASGVETRSAGQGEGQRFFVRAVPGMNKGEMIFKIDFAKSAFRPQSVSVKDSLFLFDTENGAAAQDVVAKTQWSTDGNVWLDVRSASTVDEQRNRSSSGTKTVRLSGSPEVFYYKVVFESKKGAFVSDQNQWGRGAAKGTVFELNFE